MQGERLWHDGTVPAAFRGDAKVWCQDSGMEGALVSQPGEGWTDWNPLVGQEDIAEWFGG